VIKHVRLSLLTPEELKQVEQENEKDKMIPVSARVLNLACVAFVAPRFYWKAHAREASNDAARGMKKR